MEGRGRGGGARVKEEGSFSTGPTRCLNFVRHPTPQEPQNLVKHDKMSPPEPSRHIKYGRLSFPEPSRHVKYNRLSPNEPESSIHPSNPAPQPPSPPAPHAREGFYLADSDPRKTRQIEPPRPRILDTFITCSSAPANISSHPRINLSPNSDQLRTTLVHPRIIQYVNIMYHDSPDPHS